MRKFITIAEMRYLQKQVDLGGMTYSQLIEVLNNKAKEYHQSELLKLNKSDVISSVCICECGKEASCPVCRDCFKKGLEREQTDL